MLTRYARQSRFIGQAAPLLAILLTANLAPAAHAEQTVYVNGRVYAPDGRQPLPNANVTIFGDQNNILATTRTDATGRYNVALTEQALHMPKKPKMNIGKMLLGGLLEVASMGLGPVGSLVFDETFGRVTDKVLMGSMGSNTLNRALGGRVTPQDAQRLLAAGMPPEKVAEMVRYSQTHFDAEGNFVPTLGAPGTVFVRVALPEHRDVAGVAQVYRMRKENLRAPDGKEIKAEVAWLDPIILAPLAPPAPPTPPVDQAVAPDSPATPANQTPPGTLTPPTPPTPPTNQTPPANQTALTPPGGQTTGAQPPVPVAPIASHFMRSYYTFTDASITPAMAQRGQIVVLSATFITPPDAPVPVIVLAHENKTSHTYELTPMGNGVYKTRIEVDHGFSIKPHLISLLAYNQRPDKPGRDKDHEGMLDYLKIWDAEKAFVYLPEYTASRNRGQVLLNVVKP